MEQRALELCTAACKDAVFVDCGDFRAGRLRGRGVHRRGDHVPGGGAALKTAIWYSIMLIGLWLLMLGDYHIPWHVQVFYAIGWMQIANRCEDYYESLGRK